MRSAMTRVLLGIVVLSGAVPPCPLRANPICVRRQKMKWVLTCFVTALLILAAPICSADELTAFDNHLEQLEDFLAKYSPPSVLDTETLENLDGGLSLFLGDLSAMMAGVDQARRTRALAIVESIFSRRYGLKSPALALSLLNRYDPVRARELAYGGLRDTVPVVTMASAAILLQAGEWDLAAPVLDSLGDFRALTSTSDPRAVPLLHRAIETAVDPERRISAAYWLGYVYKEWDTALATARQETLQNRDKMSDYWRAMTLQILRNGTSSEDVRAIAEFVRDSEGSVGVVGDALDALARMALRGVPDAETTLQNLAASGSEERKASVRQVLKHLKEAKEAK
jgi:hypothetical protein